MAAKSSIAVVVLEERDSLSNYRFPKSSRLLKAHQFRALAQKAFCFKGTSLLIFWKQTDRRVPRLGITVMKKYGKAVRRNRFKRYVREAFRVLFAKKAVGIDLNVRPRASSEVPLHFDDVCRDFEEFLQQLGSPHAGNNHKPPYT